MAAQDLEPSTAKWRDWPPLDAPKAACLYPWCRRRLTYRPEGSGRQPLFCGRSHRDLYGRERRALEQQLAGARDAGDGRRVGELEWKLLRYPNLNALGSFRRDAQPRGAGTKPDSIPYT